MKNKDQSKKIEKLNLKETDLKNLSLIDNIHKWSRRHAI